jgi:hypothetical protein
VTEGQVARCEEQTPATTGSAISLLSRFADRLAARRYDRVYALAMRRRAGHRSVRS